MITNQKIATTYFVKALKKIKTDETIIAIAKQVTLKFNSILSISDFLRTKFDGEDMYLRKSFELSYDKENNKFMDNADGIFIFHIQLGDDKFFIKKLKYPYNEKDIYDRIITLYEKDILKNQKEFLKRSNTNTTVEQLISSRKIDVSDISSFKELLNYKKYVGLRRNEKEYLIDKFFEEYVEEYFKSFGYKIEYSHNRKKINYDKNMPAIEDFLSFNNKEQTQLSFDYLNKKNLSDDDKNTLVAALITKNNRFITNENIYQFKLLNSLKLNSYMKNIVNRFLKSTFKNSILNLINQSDISEDDVKSINYLIGIAFSKVSPSVDLRDFLLATRKSELSHFKKISSDIKFKIKDDDIIYTYAVLGNKFPNALIYEKLLYLYDNKIIKNKNKYLSNKYFDHVIFFNNDNKIFMHPTISKDNFKNLTNAITERKNK